ncbi:hypothetical protein P7K49_006171, partial [Saguinus oedipus]
SYYNTTLYAKKKKKKLTLGMFMKMNEIDAFSLSYQGAVPNIFKGSLAFFQQRYYLIYCSAYCDVCTTRLPT